MNTLIADHRRLAAAFQAHGMCDDTRRKRGSAGSLTDKTPMRSKSTKLNRIPAAVAGLKTDFTPRTGLTRPNFIPLPARGGDPIWGLPRSWWIRAEREGLIQLARPRWCRRVLLPACDATALVQRLSYPREQNSCADGFAAGVSRSFPFEIDRLLSPTMAGNSTLVFDLEEKFPNLPHAPIVEAVIQIHGRATAAWEEMAIINSLTPRLPDYFAQQSERAMQSEIRPGSRAPIVRDLGWKGVKFMSKDKTQIANFGRDSFSFSRLRPYLNWEQFISEALRLWPIHRDVAKVAEVVRIGVRFINQMPAPNIAFDASRIFTEVAAASSGLRLPLQHFYQNARFVVPGHPFAVNVVRAVQPLAGTNTPPLVILDIDVSMSAPFTADSMEWEKELPKFRWLKNKLFFDNFTPETLSTFR